MPDYQYDVLLETLLGERRGAMKLHVRHRRVDGYLKLFGHTEPVSGVVGKDGIYRLSGKFVTLMSEFYYMATGRADKEKLDLTIYGGRAVFRMTGTAPTGSEGIHP